MSGPNLHADHALEWLETGVVSHPVVGIYTDRIVVDWSEAETEDTTHSAVWCATCGTEVSDDDLGLDGYHRVEGLPFDHQRFTVDQWRAEVAAGDTHLGYRDWVYLQARLEMP